MEIHIKKEKIEDLVFMDPVDDDMFVDEVSAIADNLEKDYDIVYQEKCFEVLCNLLADGAILYKEKETLIIKSIVNYKSAIEWFFNEEDEKLFNSLAHTKNALKDAILFAAHKRASKSTEPIVEELRKIEKAFEQLQYVEDFIPLVNSPHQDLC